jgi:hypothetical protein
MAALDHRPEESVECTTTAGTTGRQLRHGDSSASGFAVTVRHDSSIGNFHLALDEPA